MHAIRHLRAVAAAVDAEDLDAERRVDATQVLAALHQGDLGAPLGREVVAEAKADGDTAIDV